MPLNVRAWLEAEGFGRFADLFESRQVDGDALPLLTEAHLRELGIPLGPRVKLLAAIQRLAAGGGHQAERRRLTVMFVDLVGSTALASRHDPEELRELIRDYQRVVAGGVERYEAHVARFFGDGALVYFGYPKAHEDDPERAVRAALGIVRAVAELRSPAGEPLAAHIGIATGLVVVGDLLVAGAAKERTVLGETPNLAARLEQLAGPGEIVVSAQTRELTGRHFEWRALAPQAIKGLDEPVVAYAFEREREVATRFEARHGRDLLAMVGRQAELALLEQRWRLAVEGRGQLVVLAGEAGIGKSRIVRELEEALSGEPHLRMTCQCSPYHVDVSLHPIIQQMVRAARLDARSAPASRLDRLAALFEGAAPADVALIASLLGIECDGRYPKPELSPEQQRAHAFEALLKQLERASRTKPVLWVMEDAHWIDPTTLELVAMAAGRVSTLPVLAVLTARPEFADNFAAMPNLTRLSLGRLTRTEIAALVRQLTHGKPLPAPVLTEIAAKTDGVPLFVEELTKSVLEAGALRETEDAYVIEGGTPRALSVPASLHDSMMARLDRHAALKEVAQTASCIGREFSHELLQAACAMSKEALDDGLTRLVEAQLVFRRGDAGERRYVFKHALVRDAAYESLLKSRRQEIHSRILQALESTPGSAPEVLAQHANEAGMLDAAIEYWQKAGALAIARPAYQEAISHVQQALRLAERMGDGPGQAERRLKLLLLLGQATIPLRGYSHSETLAVFKRAQQIAVAGHAPHSFSISYAMWVAYYVRGEHPRALAIAREMQEQAQREGSASKMLTALRALGIVQMIIGDLAPAQATFEEAQKLAYVLQQQSREHRIAVAHRFAADPDIATQFHVALTAFALGRVDRARALASQAVASARSIGHVHTLGHALTHGAIFAVALRDAPAARRLAEEAITFAEEHDMELWRGYGSIVKAQAMALAGEAEPAIPVLKAGLAHLVRTETGTMVAMGRAVHAYALASVGRFDEAAAEAEVVREALRSGSDRYWWPETLRWLGGYLARMPRPAWSEVEDCYARALALAREQGAQSFGLGAATSLARHWADRGERDGAFALLAPLLAAFEEGPDAPFVREAASLVEQLRTRPVTESSALPLA